MFNARESSVRQLSELYTVVIGVALSAGIYNSVDNSHPLVPLKLSQIINVVTFLIILVPFYHGAVRHLFVTHVDNGGSKLIKNGALLADFFLLFLEGCVFVLLANILGQTEKFTIVLISLLILDSAWGFLAWLAFTGGQAQYAERTWALINVTTAVILIVLVVFDENTFVTRPVLSQLGLLAVIALRTIFDYYYCWNFYFPNNSGLGPT